MRSERRRKGTPAAERADALTRVHHEELTLVGHGWLAFGQPRAEAVQVVKFRCVDGGPTESKA